MRYVRMNIMRAGRLHSALQRLTAAIQDVENELAAMKAEQDPLASHIYVSRRHYRHANDTKSGKRREIKARLSFNTACERIQPCPDSWRMQRRHPFQVLPNVAFSRRRGAHAI